MVIKCMIQVMLHCVLVDWYHMNNGGSTILYSLLMSRSCGNEEQKMASLDSYMFLVYHVSELSASCLRMSSHQVLLLDLCCSVWLCWRESVWKEVENISSASRCLTTLTVRIRIKSPPLHLNYVGTRLKLQDIQSSAEPPTGLKLSLSHEIQ